MGWVNMKWLKKKAHKTYIYIIHRKNHKPRIKKYAKCSKGYKDVWGMGKSYHLCVTEVLEGEQRD